MVYEKHKTFNMKYAYERIENERIENHLSEAWD